MNVLFSNTGVLANDIRVQDLAVEAGPLSGMLTTARDQLAEKALSRGVSLSVSFDMEELVRVNQAAVDAGTWEPMLPAAHPQCRRLRPSNALWIRGANPDGEVVTAQAAVLYDCSTISIGERFANMTVFYDDPINQAPEEEWCECVSEAAHATRGAVVWTLAGWTRPDLQGRGLFPICQRLNKLAAWLLWAPASYISVVDPEIVPVWAERKMGPRHIDANPTITYNQVGLKTLPMHFVRFSRAQFLGDLAQMAVEAAVG